MATFRCTAILLALALFASPALAAKKKKNNGSSPNPALPASTSGGQSAVTPSDSTDADGQAIKANMDDATSAVKKAQADLDAYVTSRKADFDKTDAVAALLKTVADEKAVLDTLASPIRAQLAESDSRYANAVKSLPDAQTKLDAAKAAKNADEAVFQKSEVDRYTATINDIEKAAFAKSPDYAPAKAKYDADAAKLADAEAGFPAFLDGSPDYPSLKLALSNATAHLNALQGTVASK